MTIFISIKGGPGSGNWGHRGRPGKRGGSSARSVKLTHRAQEILSKLESLRSRVNADVDMPMKSAIKSMETLDKYGSVSTSEAAITYTHRPFWYGEDVFGNEHKLSRSLQDEILASSIPFNDTLWRGVSGRHAQSLQRAKIGDTIKLTGKFTSTSRSKYISSIFANEGSAPYVFSISIKAGQPGLFVDDTASEILLKGDTMLLKIGDNDYEYIT